VIVCVCVCICCLTWRNKQYIYIANVNATNGRLASLASITWISVGNAELKCVNDAAATKPRRSTLQIATDLHVECCD